MKILVLVNALNSVSSFVYSNHVAFWCKTKEDFPKEKGHDFFFFTPPRMSIDMARNTAAREALARNADYLLFIDDDVLIPTDTLSQLLACDADIAAGLVVIRGYPFNVMAFKKDSEFLPYFNNLPTIKVKINDEGDELEVLKNPVTREDGLVAVGFSCCLIKCSLLKAIPTPYFVTGPRNTEDVYFCLKAKDYKEDVTIAMATSVQCGHMLHPEPIEYRTIDLFKEFYEALDPNTVNQIRTDEGRNENYIKRNLEGL